MATDWSGWNWPVPLWMGRTPVITQEWKPGGDPEVGTPSGEFTNHAGVDIMFRKTPLDPPGNMLHDAEGPFIAPQGTPIIAAGPGKIWAKGEEPYYGKWVQVDHGPYGINTWYQHLESWEKDWQKGDVVSAGDILGRMGYGPGDPQGLRHLHFEVWTYPNGSQYRGNPVPFLAQWPMVPVSEAGSLLSRAWNALGSVGPIPIAPVAAGGLLWWLLKR